MAKNKNSNQSLPWFRLYTEIVDDEKLRLLAFEDRWHYVALLACKGKGILDQNTDVELLERKLAVKLGLQVRELGELNRRLREVGLIDQNWQPLGWHKRQYKSDNSTARVQAHRANKRAKASSETGETLQKRSRNGPDTEADTDSDTEKNSPGNRKGDIEVVDRGEDARGGFASEEDVPW
ncbi:hypothetical protein [Halorhodospira halophila]|uniref:hypothetical protein n=1 Tax=Halorhodospira halophila TaxID=1053 RepID=UPI001913C188|nr:hypothetical protein [Halorhodospira halophila]MBK5943346.1 hypothetical protein [Halorhodospira halophila]